ncbi:MAG TPA: LEPR-XLL domain-containing protein [Patescibacteria group bacterium]|nr:LEPR-XLL domain-containing protein [Patescibacteria group bacterium]
MNRRLSLCLGLVLILLPAAVRAEVSVQLDQQGRVKRVVYLTRGSGAGAVIWGQVRGRLPLEVMLNPLGDNLGDQPPAIAVNPKTGAPMVVWPQNVGNQMRLVYSTFADKAWTPPVPIVRPDLVGSDQIEPRLLLDADGVPYLFFTEAAHPARILFLTMSRGTWTPPVLVSDAQIDSRRPAASLVESGMRLTYSTPAGAVEQVLSTTMLLESATSLMDSPIPPGAVPKPTQPTVPPTNDPGDLTKYRR